MGWDEPLSNVIEDGLEHYLKYAKTQTHAQGTRLEDKHVVTRVIEQALEAILVDPAVTVIPAQVRDWVSQHHSFRIRLWRIDEHCKYKAGDKSFPQPKKNPDLRIVGPNEYAVAEGNERYTYETRTLKNK